MLIQILLGRGRAPTSAEKAKIFWFIQSKNLLVYPRTSAKIRVQLGFPAGLGAKSLETTLVIKI
ncbi:MAG: hypothetical protein NTW32_01045 [Chloroflexi bacterium]|nr:hypothetical protein [Chloroflexota bacterium]